MRTVRRWEKIRSVLQAPDRLCRVKRVGPNDILKQELVDPHRQWHSLSEKAPFA